MRRILLLALLPLVLSAAEHRYIVELTGEPATHYATRVLKKASRESLHAVASARRSAILREQTAARARFNGMGIHTLASVDTVLNALIVEMDDSLLDNLRAAPGVFRVTREVPFKLHLDHALPLQKVPDAWAQVGGINNPGTGMKIGIVDTGIDATHPGFKDSSMTAPDGYPKYNRAGDKAATSGKIIVARTYKEQSTD